MFPATRQNNFPVAYNANQGLNGFFGRLAKKLIQAAFKTLSAIPLVNVVAEEISTAINDWAGGYDGSFWNRTAQTYEPNASEEAILTQWTTSKFNVFFKRIGEELSAAISLNGSGKFQAVNNVLAKMQYVQTYFATNETAGLSAKAIEFRSQFMQEVFNPLVRLIEENMAGYALESDTALPGSASSYAPLINNVLQNAFAVHLFRDPTESASGEILSPIELPGIKPIKTPVTTQPVTTIPVNTLPVTTQPGTPTKTDSTGRNKKIIGGLAIAVLLYFGLKKSK